MMNPLKKTILSLFFLAVFLLLTTICVGQGDNIEIDRPIDDIHQSSSVDRKWGFKGYSGGMFLQMGYVKSPEFNVYNFAGDAIPVRVEGMSTGIGGKLGFFINQYMRVGIEGYATTTRYGEFHSSYKVGWGGALVEFVYPTKHVMPFVGITLGGGSVSHMILLEKNNDDFDADQIVYKEQGIFVINPAIGIEYFVSRRISLIFKVDYMISGSKQRLDFATGPRAYIGVHFYRRK